MSNRSRGQYYERKAKGLLESWGYVVEKARRASMFGSEDFFGCMDLIGIKSDSVVRFVQVTCAKSVSGKKREIEAVPWPHQHSIVEVWQAFGRGKWRYHILKPEGGWRVVE